MTNGFFYFIFHVNNGMYLQVDSSLKKIENGKSAAKLNMAPVDSTWLATTQFTDQEKVNMKSKNNRAEQI
jgi:hypothetical protein